MTNLDSVEKQWHYSANKGAYSEGLHSGHVWLWELDHKEGWMPNKWCLWTVVLEKIPKSLLDSREIKPVNLKRDQPWICTGRTDAEAEASVFWSLDENSRLIGSPWCWEWLRAEGEEGIRGWDGWMASPMQWTWTWANFRRWWGSGTLACCSLWDCKELDMSGWLNNIKSTISLFIFFQATPRLKTWYPKTKMWEK